MPILVVTGDPGVGKTTVVMRVAEVLKQRGLKVGGVVSREVRCHNARVGFEFIDLTSNETATLSSTTGSGPRIGKYLVDLAGCRFAVRVLKEAIESSDIIICDELGPMEFKSEEFVDCVGKMLNINKPLITVVHRRLKHPAVEQFRNKASFMINIDIQNRNKAPDLLLDRLK
ncbi:MAG: NTPase [Nitrososphaerales archaeon]